MQTFTSLLISFYLIKTQIWVSLMISCLGVFFCLAHQNISIYRILLIFSANLSAYNFLQFHSIWKSKFYFQLSFIFFILGACSCLILLILIDNKLLFLQFLFISFITYLYNSHFLKLKLRNIPFIKIFIIAFSWTYTILFIGVNAKINWFEWLSLYFFILGITFPFDVVDYNVDKIKTIPKLIGINQTKKLACFCLLLSCILGFLSLGQIYFIISWCSSCFLGIFIILKKKITFFYTRFIVEAISSFPLIFFYLQKIKVIP